MKTRLLKPAVTIRDVLRQQLRSALARRVFMVCRWMHIYISSALFALLIFFCITGITLNHPQWFSKGEVNVQVFDLPMNVVSKLQTTESMSAGPLLKYLEGTFNLTKPRSVEWALEEDEVTVDYSLPAGYAFVIANITTGETEIEYQQGSFILLLNDLHKGRHSGETWRWVIDLSAILMLIFSVTGFVILLQNSKHRKQAMLAVLGGGVLPWLIYLLVVPRLIMPM